MLVNQLGLVVGDVEADMKGQGCLQCHQMRDKSQRWREIVLILGLLCQACFQDELEVVAGGEKRV